MTDETRLAWWKPWRWPFAVGLMVLVVSLVIVAFGVRMYFLSLVPAIAEPFDVAEFIRVADDIPPEENGGENYRRANEMADQVFAPLLGPSQVAYSICELRWSDANESGRQVMDQLRPSLHEWRAGTEKRFGQITPLAEMEWDTLLYVEQRFRFVDRLAAFEASRLEAEGDFEGAWRWYRAVYRCIGHLGRRNILVPRCIGWSMHSFVSDRVASWAENPSVTAEQLRTARADIRAAVAEMGPMSDTLKAEYISFEKSLQRRDWPLGMVALPNAAWLQKVYTPTVGPLLWIVGEPELTRRIYRHTLTNQLAEIDKPLHEARPVARTGSALLFDPPNRESVSPGGLSPTEIRIACRQSLIASPVVVNDAGYYTVILRERAWFQLTDLCLTLQLFKRERGEYPEGLDQLVPDYLEAVPLDAFDAAGLPIRYRREKPDRAVVWSIGPNRTDDDGEVGDSALGNTPDYGRVLK